MTLEESGDVPALRGQYLINTRMSVWKHGIINLWLIHIYVFGMSGARVTSYSIADPE